MLFKLGGVDYRDRAVQAGHRYIAENAMKHLEERGEKTRYAAFGLWGLSAYDEALHDPAWDRIRSDLLAWLDGAQLSSGGWGENASEHPPQLMVTSVAVEACDRICGNGPAGNLARSLAARGRSSIVALKTDDRKPYWSDSPEGWSKGNVAATARATIALKGGDEAQRVMAKKSANWLLARRGHWVSKVQVDGSVREASWTEMSFSLATRAVLAVPDARHNFSDEKLRPVLEEMDRLWSPEEGKWSHGSPGIRTSPSGSVAVVLAMDAIRQDWRYLSLPEVGNRRPRRRLEHNDVSIRVEEPFDVVVIDPDGAEIARCGLKRSKQKQALFLLLARRRPPGPRSDLTAVEQSVSPEDIAETLGIGLASVPVYCGRLNDDLKESAPGELGDLVQKVEVPGGKVRWLINVEDIDLGSAGRESNSS